MKIILASYFSGINQVNSPINAFTDSNIKVYLKYFT